MSDATTRPAGRGRWMVLGVVVGYAGLAVGYALSLILRIRDSPVDAVADLIIRLTPGPVVEWAIKTLGALDKPLLILGIMVVLTAMFVVVGRLARVSFAAAVAGFAVIAGLAALAIAVRPGFGWGELLPLAGGFGVWLLTLLWLREPLTRVPAAATSAGTSRPGPVDSGVDAGEWAPQEGDPEAPQPVGPTAPTAAPAGEFVPAEALPATAAPPSSRRDFLRRSTLVVAGSAAVALLGRTLGGARRSVEEARRLLRLDGVSRPMVPAGVKVGVDGVTPWMTPVDDFYLIHTNYSLPAIEPKDWLLRIHGMVDQEMTFTYSDLVNRKLTESWITLNCVSNTVGGDLIGNAWWSGVRVKDLLDEVGVQAAADCVLQTSDTGWTCSTPLDALTDDRNAMLAVAMNGEPLTLEHGFPVRTVVPGLYGYVSACKWVVDFEVTRFDEVDAYWTERGWSEQGPVKIASRIDVPGDGDSVAAGRVVVAGVAWMQHTGIAGVAVSVDDGAWQEAELGGLVHPKRPNRDTWVQWRIVLDLPAGDHTLKVRATDLEGRTQTGKEVDPVPDGATGWHTIEISAED